MKTLVVGCDASGKTTVLDGVRKRWNDTLAESTRSEEASAFRRANHERVIDAEYIAQREALYLKLSHQALFNAQQLSGHIITSDSSLVTRLSHSTMRQVINEPHLSNEQVIDAWRTDEEKAEAPSPDIIVLTHADFSVIRERIIKRQATDRLEHFWGFNAPLFLEAYQERWHEVVAELSRASFTCLSFDTSKRSEQECLDTYAVTREALLS